MPGINNLEDLAKQPLPIFYSEPANFAISEVKRKLGKQEVLEGYEIGFKFWSHTERSSSVYFPRKTTLAEVYTKIASEINKTLSSKNEVSNQLSN